MSEGRMINVNQPAISALLAAIRAPDSEMRVVAEAMAELLKNRRMADVVGALAACFVDYEIADTGTPIGVEILDYAMQLIALTKLQRGDPEAYLAEGDGGTAGTTRQGETISNEQAERLIRTYKPSEGGYTN